VSRLSLVRTNRSAAGPACLVPAKTRSILDTCSGRDPELIVSELESRTHLPKTTCARLRRNLVVDGFLERVGDRYRVGVVSIRWASRALVGRSIDESSSPVVDWLREQTGERVQFACGRVVSSLRSGPFDSFAFLTPHTHMCVANPPYPSGRCGRAGTR
jgi:hypothetical protein